MVRFYYSQKKIQELIMLWLYANVLQISEGINSVGFSEGFGLLLMCC